MQILFVIIVLALVNGASFAGERNVLKGGENVSEPSIVNVLPAEYAAYEKALTGDSGLNDVRAALVLLSQAKASLLRSSGAEKQDRTSAYRATWRLCIRMMKKSSDQAAKKLIIDEWNKSLREDNAAVPSQIYALSEQWDRKLLTDDFWRLLAQTSKRRTISAICYVLYEHGEASDVVRLMEKRKSCIDVEIQGIIQNAINWMNYRLSGDTTNPGPAAAPPRME